MRILLAANASYAPPRGGSTRSNLAWIHRLSANGHECRIVAAAEERPENPRIHPFPDSAHRGAFLEKQIREFQPDWVLVSSEDIGQVLLRAAHAEAPGRVIYLAHTPQFFPFGPASWNPDPHGTELVARCARVVAISHYVAAYVERHAGCRATVIHPPIYGKGPFPGLAGELIAIINPCAVKGISIFLELAAQFPEHRFGALPGWGTTAADRAALETAGNVTLLQPRPEIGDILRNVSILLVPSLWHEGFGLVVTEAMLRGIPVLASDAGGLVEAKLGTRFVIPVRPIERYERAFDEKGMPRPVIPPQEIEPWAAALRNVLADRERESEASRDAALRFVSTIREDAMEELLRSGPLRILLAQNARYFPAHGGGDKSNRLLLEALAGRGHACRVVARIPRFGPHEHGRFVDELRSRGIEPDLSTPGIVVFRRNDVEVHTAAHVDNFRSYFAGQISAFGPSVILVSTDDPAHLLLPSALDAPSARVVYLARTTLPLPFGPDSAFPSPEKTEMLRNADAVAGVSQYVSDYIRRWSGIESVAPPISLPDPGPYPMLGRFENEFVTLVNPCAVKGISIFLELARRMPHIRFAAVPTWGATPDDRAALEHQPNIHILPAADNIDEILARTRVLLVPSLWAEARSRIVVEAMLRGVPVLASDVGGIPEAKMGVPYLLPVRPIEKYRSSLDESMVPVADVPEQNVGPWQQALERLLSEREHYERLSKESRQAALAWAASVSVTPFEKLLQDLVRSPRRRRTVLSPEKRALLALRLRKRRKWFSMADTATDDKPRLFCFPFAGGSPAAFRGWAEALPEISLCPVRRSAEPAFEPLVAALTDAIAPYARKPYALYGHSMGAAIAFELARSLRRRDRPLPLCLFVSGARAPQLRRGHEPPPEPSEEEFLDELRRLEGMPGEVLADNELLRSILPALRADTALYRNYIYTDEPPLACPIRAYGGIDDPNVRPGHLEAWREQTTTDFSLRLFPGGHFFIDTARDEFLEALQLDAEALRRRV